MTTTVKLLEKNVRDRKSRASAGGHRCLGAKFSVRVSCQCGWTSSNWSGAGARANAYSEWRTHAQSHEKKVVR